MRRLASFLRQHARLLSFSFFHALLLVILTYYWLNLNLEFADDMVKVTRISQIVQYLLVDKSDPVAEDIKKNLVLINCSYDKMLVPFEDDRGTGTRAVINRQLLTEMVRIIRPSKPQMVIWDIFMDSPSDLDSAMYAELALLSPLIMSTKLNDEGLMIRPREGFLYARAQYETTIGTFLKYRLMDSDTIKYVPAVMYETATGDSLSRLGAFAWSKKAWWLNSFIVDISIRKSHIENNEIVMWNLGEILKYTSAAEIQSFTAGKIVVLGDFYEFDNHETLLGEQPGPLIIVNTYLGLLKGVPKITFWSFFLIFILYFGSTFYIIRFKSFRQHLLTSRVLQGKVMKWIVRYFTYILIYSVYAAILYALTGKHFELLLFAIYFNVFEFVVTKYQKRIGGLLMKPEELSKRA